MLTGQSANALVHCVPVEILSYIFYGVGDPFAISRVCRRWREIAWADPHLWTTITLIGDDKTHPQLLQHYLDRSRSAPLKVDVRACPVDHDEERDCNCDVNLELVLSHLFRIKDLKVSAQPLLEDMYPDISLSKILQEAFSTYDIPILESLELSAYYEPWLPDCGTYYPTHAPVLQKFRLNNALISWHSAIFRNLTELYINLSDLPSHLDEDEYLMDIDQLFDILKSSPSLCLLFLCSCCSIDEDITTEDLENVRSISLHCLKDITLRYMPSIIYLAIAEKVETPQCANWYIQDLFPSEDHLPSICNVFKVLALQQEKLQTRELTLALVENSISLFSSRLIDDSLKIDSARVNVIDVSFGFRKGTCLTDRNNSASRIPLFQDVAHIISAMNRANNVVKFCVHFKRLEHIQRKYGDRITMEKVFYESSTWTKPLLRVMPELEYLIIKPLFECEKLPQKDEDELYYYKRGFLEGMIRNLMTDAPASSRDTLPKGEIICPKLQTVEIAHGHGFLSGDLKRLLASRFKRGVPIRRLHMSWSEEVPILSDEWIGEVEKLVDRVSVGIEINDEKWASHFKPKHDEFLGYSYFYRSHPPLRSIFEYEPFPWPF